jgi:hypothetical protein
MRKITERRPKKLLDRVRETIRRKHYSFLTERSYVSWIRRYTLFHNKRDPQKVGRAEIAAFLTYIRVNREMLAVGLPSDLVVALKVHRGQTESSFSSA